MLSVISRRLGQRTIIDGNWVTRRDSPSLELGLVRAQGPKHVPKAYRHMRKAPIGRGCIDHTILRKDKRVIKWERKRMSGR